MHAHEWAPPPALRPELSRLVDAGVFARAAHDDGHRLTPFDELARATRSGVLTAGQAAALAALLGLSGACRPANDAAAPRAAALAPANAKR